MPQEYNELFWLILIFVLLSTISFSLVYRLTSNRRPRERLKVKDDELGSKTELMLGGMTEGLAAQVPVRGEARTDVQKELLAAGYYRKSAITEYAAIRTILTIAPVLIAGVVAALSDTANLLTVLIVGAMAAMLGYSIPRIVVILQGRVRSRQIARALPVAVDMLTLCLSAGQNIQNALQRVSVELKFSHRALSDELEIVRQQAELRTLQHALQQFADRVQVPEVRNLAMILIQSERLGTDAAATLLEYSANLRTTLRQRADAKANRTMFWMLFPTLLCLWIPAGIVLIGPAVLEFQSYRKGYVNQWRDAKRELQELKEAGQRAVQPVTPAPEQPSP